MRQATGMYDSEPEDEETLETRKTATEIRKRKAFLRKQSWLKKSRNYPVMPRGVTHEGRPRKRAASPEGMEDGDNMEEMEEGQLYYNYSESLLSL